MLLIPLAIWWTLRESPERRIDREFGWKEVKPYVTATHGVEVGSITVLRHTQMVTFYMWGIPKEAYLDEDGEPKIIGEMDRDILLRDSDKVDDLSRIALAAYNHGGSRVILTTHKAYLVTSDVEEYAKDTAWQAGAP